MYDNKLENLVRTFSRKINTTYKTSYKKKLKFCFLNYNKIGSINYNFLQNSRPWKTKKSKANLPQSLSEIIWEAKYPKLFYTSKKLWHSTQKDINKEKK